MLVYRISLARWAGQLAASGQAARWNSKGRFVIYTAASRALACLENVVHRSGEGLNQPFRVLSIDVPDEVAVERLDLMSLPSDWTSFLRYPDCQALGDRWLDVKNTAILRVPSALIPNEFNYLLNPTHPHFTRIQLLGTEEFIFDPRLKRSGSDGT